MHRVFHRSFAPRAMLVLLAVSAGTRAQEHPPLAIGSTAPDFALPGVDGKIHKLSDYSSSRFLAIMFICNHCPTSQLYESRIKKLVDDYRPKDVAFLAIQPNDP